MFRLGNKNCILSRESLIWRFKEREVIRWGLDNETSLSGCLPLTVLHPHLHLILASFSPAGSRWRLWCSLSLSFPMMPAVSEVHLFGFLLSPVSAFDSAVSSQIPNRLSKSCLWTKASLLCPVCEKETEMRRQTKGETDALREFPNIAQQQCQENLSRAASHKAELKWNK